MARHKYLLILFLLSSHAYAMSLAPCSSEYAELENSTPGRPVLLSTLLVSDAAAFALMAEHGPPATRSDSLKQGYGIGILGLNYILAFAYGSCAGKQGLNAPRLSEDQRSELRGKRIDRAVTIAAIETVANVGMFVVAEHPTNRALAAAAIATPLIASFFVLDRYKKGPDTEHRSNKPEVTVAPAIYQQLPSSRIDPGFSISLAY